MLAARLMRVAVGSAVPASAPPRPQILAYLEQLATPDTQVGVAALSEQLAVLAHQLAQWAKRVPKVKPMLADLLVRLKASRLRFIY